MPGSEIRALMGTGYVWQTLLTDRIGGFVVNHYCGNTFLTLGRGCNRLDIPNRPTSAASHIAFGERAAGT